MSEERPAQRPRVSSSCWPYGCLRVGGYSPPAEGWARAISRQSVNRAMGSAPRIHERCPAVTLQHHGRASDLARRESLSWHRLLC